MNDVKIEKLLNELTEATRIPVRTGLSQEIKGQIPSNFGYSKRNRDGFNIMIDLRISKIAAAAIIIITLFLSASYYGAPDSAGSSFLRDSKVMLRYIIKGEKAKTTLASGSMEDLYKMLVQSGRDVVYYGDTTTVKDKDAIIMQWKIADNKYSVVFGDLSVKTVTAEELVKLQAKMLQKQQK
jgi:hypothetical protein